jgi:predicted secreted protein
MGANNTTGTKFGNDFILLVESEDGGGYQQIAHATSHSIDVTRASRTVASKSTGDWTFSEYGKASWSGSAEALYSADSGVYNHTYLQDLQIARKKIKIISVGLSDSPIGDTTSVPDNALDPSDGAPGAFEAGSDYYVGDAVLTSVSISASEGDNVTFSISFEGASILEKKTVSGATNYTVTITADDGIVTNYGDFAVIDNKLVLLNASGVGTIDLPDGTYGVTAGKNDGSLSGDNTVTVAGAPVAVQVTIA